MYKRARSGGVRARLQKGVAALVTALAGAGLAYSSSAVAQSVPLALTQQGRLLDASGAPVDGVALAFTFSIYSADTGGTPIWTESQNITPDQGYFSARLGENSPFPATLFDGSQGALYLGIKIGNDTEMAPRQKLTSVPFALLAANASGATGALDTRISSIENGKANKATLPVVTAWQSYTPCSLFDTGATAPAPNVGSGQCWYRRVGDSADLRAVITFAGTVAATQGFLALRLPPGLTMDVAKVPTPDTAVGSGWVGGQAASYGVRTVALDMTSASSLIFVMSGDDPGNGANVIFKNGTPFNLTAGNGAVHATASVPIVGWGVTAP